MKPLLLLLILDYSGSMYQPVQNIPKYKIVQENVEALKNEAQRKGADSQSGYVIFGLHPKKKCSDIDYGETPTVDLSNAVNHFRPGAFAKTPLADAIQTATDKCIAKKAKRVVVFSDGFDTCGKDPCEQLVTSNEQLQRANYVMNMTFIGIDLKEDEKKFECFKTLKLSNLKINYVNSSNSFETQEALKEDDIKEPIENPYGKIVVEGAPAGVHFQLYLQGKKVPKGEWQGSYPFKVIEGGYKVSASAPGTRLVEAGIDAGVRVTLHWEDFYPYPFTKVIITNPQLSLLFTPTKETRTIHRKAYPFVIHGRLKNDEAYDNSLPFGSWQVEVASPAWLKSRAEKTTMVFDPGKKMQLDPVKIFSLNWVKNPDPSKAWAVEFDKNERYFVPPNVPKIPSLKDLSPHWINADLPVKDSEQ